ncbi:MAG: hypothetical protein LUG14_09085 [Synergistaceae bacterium]|nr:hypothetical protein [Synergistaceae bacterium]
MPAGTPCTGKLASSLKELRFDHVFDTNWGADLTIMNGGGHGAALAPKTLRQRREGLPADGYQLLSGMDQIY